MKSIHFPISVLILMILVPSLLADNGYTDDVLKAEMLLYIMAEQQQLVDSY